jgi:adenylylsulfate kinase-like enzyme
VGSGVGSGALTPVLWLCGPPGVGKTTAGWELFRQLTEAGTPAGYVDIDQLGMCYPESAADPDRHLMKTQNLGAVLDGFRAAGARCVVVSGVVHPVYGVDRELLPQAELTLCQLWSGKDELRQRYLGREGRTDLVASVLRDAEDMDASTFADLRVDTSGLPAAEVVRVLRERTGGWPGTAVTTTETPAEAPTETPAEAPTETPAEALAAAPAPVSPAGAGGPVLWVCGATGVGKSVVGYEVYSRALRAGRTAAYVDIGQLGCFGPPSADDPGGHRLRARNLASLWRTYRAVGAECLVVVGSIGDQEVAARYAEALPGADFTLARLHAGREQLTQRIMRLGRGEGWPQPGGPLRGRSVEHLLQVADQATADAEALERAALGALRVDTDRRTVSQAADVFAPWLSELEKSANVHA